MFFRWCFFDEFFQVIRYLSVGSQPRQNAGIRRRGPSPGPGPRRRMPAFRRRGPSAGPPENAPQQRESLISTIE